VPAREFKIETEMWVDADPHRVFELLTEQKHLEAWWGEEGGQQILDAEVDPRQGGRFLFRIESRRGLMGRVQGEYMVLDPGRQVLCTWHADWSGDVPSFVKFRLDPEGRGTRVVVSQRGFLASEEGAQILGEPWNVILEWLADYAARSREQPVPTG
jgi:uncharacterized protein YndB with AHSA1/START domain